MQVSLKRRKNAAIGCAIYTILWQLYQIQGTLDISIVAKIILPLLLLFSLYKAVYVITHYKVPALMKWYGALFALFIIYGIILLAVGDTKYIVIFIGHEAVPVEPFSYLKNILVGMSSVYAYYDYVKKGVFTEKAITRYILLFIGVSIISFFQYYVDFDSLFGDITNNGSYRFVPILLLLLLVKKHRIWLVMVCYSFVFMGLKRGAIIVGTILFLVHLKETIRRVDPFKKIFVFIAVIGILFTATYAISRFYDENVYFQKRVTATKKMDSSGRDYIYQKLYDRYVSDPDIKNQLIGKGANATIDVAGNYAHNDWLEIATNQGLLGLVIYSGFFMVWFVTWIKLRLKHAEISTLCVCQLISMFLMTIFSMSYSTYTGACAICFAYMLVKYREIYK